MTSPADPIPRRPVSVLVVVYATDGQVLLLKRRKPFVFWQSVTGSLWPDEEHADAARRELLEETGIDAGEGLAYDGISRVFVIDPRWRDRYPTGIVENVEFEWRLELPSTCAVKLEVREHTEYEWVPIDEAIERVWSWTNREALEGIALALQ